MHASTTILDALFKVNYHLMVFIVSPLEIFLFAANKKLRKYQFSEISVASKFWFM